LPPMCAGIDKPRKMALSGYRLRGVVNLKVCLMAHPEIWTTAVKAPP
jgi:hypothetical protein